MAFSKSFPKTTDKSMYPKWVEIFLTDVEEKEVELECRKQNIKLFKQCIDDAKNIITDTNLKQYQTDMVNIAIALFEKRASHSIFHKESRAKDKFDKTN